MAYSLDYYKARKKELEKQISDRKSKNKKISEEISRLDDAYRKMGNIKRENSDNADKVRDNTKLKKVANDVKWRGKYKNQFDNAMKDRATPAAKDFFNSIDDMQDEIGRALDAKRGEYDTGSAILNTLNSTYNTIVGTIRNWVN